MRAEKAIRAQLLGAGSVTSMVADRIWPAQVPQGTAYPALVITHISTVPQPTVDAFAEFQLMRSRIQVTALANDYATQKTLLDLVQQACNFQRGIFNGVRVSSTTRDLIGPDLRDDDRSVYVQSVDFIVLFFEP
jgi:hypothetical protein